VFSSEGQNLMSRIEGLIVEPIGGVFDPSAKKGVISNDLTNDFETDTGRIISASAAVRVTARVGDCPGFADVLSPCNVIRDVSPANAEHDANNERC